MSNLKEFTARRALLNHKNVKSTDLQDGAAELVRAGYLADAVDFFTKAQDPAGLKNLLPTVIEEGNFFLFKLIISRLEPDYQPKEDLEKLMKQAVKLGLSGYAGQAGAYLEQLGLSRK